ncbi:MAG: hypothetical protein RIC03_05000 [Cyclobacteriaceae bacterium]
MEKQKDLFIVTPPKHAKRNVFARYEAILNIERWNELESVRHNSKDGKQKDLFIVTPPKHEKRNVFARYEAILNIESWNEIDSGRHNSK